MLCGPAARPHAVQIEQPEIGLQRWRVHKDRIRHLLGVPREIYHVRPVNYLPHLMLLLLGQRDLQCIEVLPQVLRARKELVLPRDRGGKGGMARNK